MDETKKLAQFIANTQYSDLSNEVIEKTKLLVLDQIGCQLAFATLPWNKAIHNYVRDRGSSRQESTVAFYGFKTSAEDAAFANAVFGHGFEMDDTELCTASHPGVAVIPPTLALGEIEKITGKDLITAIVVGYDVFIRIGLATRSMIDRGFHTTAVLGPLGAAAASSRVMGLGADTVINALAIAASQAGGIAEYTETGGSVKRVHAGFGAQNGLKAALLARAGLTGPPTALEGKKGLCQAFSNEHSLEEITANLGTEFRILLTGNKPYGCCAAQHSTLDAVSGIVSDHLITPEKIEKIRVWQKARDVRAIGNIVTPRDIITAQFSGRFGIALRLIKGHNGFQDYSEENISDPRILDLARKIEYYVDNTMEKSNPAGAPARAEIHLEDGSIREKTVQFAKGTVQNPMTRKELEEKFRQLVVTVLSRERADAIISTIGALETLDDLRALTAQLSSDRKNICS